MPASTSSGGSSTARKSSSTSPRRFTTLFRAIVEASRAEDQAIFRRYNELNAAQLDDSDYDIIIIHDPQPVAVIDHFPSSKAKWIWRCHIDLSTPNSDVIDFLVPSISRYDAMIFHLKQYIPERPGLPPAFIWPPAIDPLAPKNMALSREDAAYILDQFGIDVERPLLTQVSRFDPWKDPLGVIDAYRQVKKKFPGVQLALVGSMAHDDPEGWDFYNRTLAYADGDPDIYILSNLNNVGSVEVNAFQVHSEVVIQKSIREGFGLTVSEGLWKAPPDRCRPGRRDRRSDSRRRDRLAGRFAGGVCSRLYRGDERPCRRACQGARGERRRSP